MQREQYIGTWLPEPLLTESLENSQDNAELAETLSFAFLMLLECLSPTERAVFLLREVFDYDYEDIAQVVGKSISNCRQIVRRSCQHLVLRRPTMQTSARPQEALIEQFLIYWNQGDLEGLITLMSEDIAFWSDGGRKTIAAQKPLYGGLKIARFLIAIRASKLTPVLLPQVVNINSQPGILNQFVNGERHSIFSFDVVDEKIRSIFAVVNPEKLRTMKL